MRCTWCADTPQRGPVYRPKKNPSARQSPGVFCRVQNACSRPGITSRPDDSKVLVQVLCEACKVP
nr:MAG TPA: hypothetical protein [Inoviridae sp.]